MVELVLLSAKSSVTAFYHRKIVLLLEFQLNFVGVVFHTSANARCLA